MSNNNPSIDPADNESLAGSLRFAFNKLMQQTDGMLPAKIVAYDRATNRAQVQILITLITTDGSRVSRPQVASLPVLRLGGGGYFLSFPLNPGDLGWIMANDRDISLFLQEYVESPPNTSRIKNFSDALFIPDAMTGYTIDGADEDYPVLSNLDGTVKIVLKPTGVEITSPLVTVNGDLFVTGTITGGEGISVSGGAGMSVTGDFNMTGNMLVNGNIGATGTITPGV